jgi:hypothetical protein
MARRFVWPPDHLQPQIPRPDERAVVLWQNRLNAVILVLGIVGLIALATCTRYACAVIRDIWNPSVSESHLRGKPLADLGPCGLPTRIGGLQY